MLNWICARDTMPAAIPGMLCPSSAFHGAASAGLGIAATTVASH